MISIFIWSVGIGLGISVLVAGAAQHDYTKVFGSGLGLGVCLAALVSGVLYRICDAIEAATSSTSDTAQ